MHRPSTVFAPSPYFASFVSQCPCFFSWILVAIAFLGQVAGAEVEFNHVLAQNPPQQRGARQEGSSQLVYRDRVAPNWFANGSKFWYRNDLGDGKREFVLVDAEKGIKKLALDHEAVADKMGDAVHASRLPIDRLEFSDDGTRIIFLGQKRWEWIASTKELIETKESFSQKTDSPSSRNAVALGATRNGEETSLAFENKSSESVEIFWISPDGVRTSYGKIASGATRDQHTFGGHQWVVVNATGEDLLVTVATDQASLVVIDGTKSIPATPPRRRNRERNQNSDASKSRSPDGKWSAEIKNHNVLLKSDSDPSEVFLSTDGVEGNVYDQLGWSPDSKSLVAFRVELGDKPEVHLVQSSPEGGGRAKLQSRPYALPGDKFTSCELSVFDIATQKQLKPIVDRFESEWQRPRIRWSHDGSRFTYQQTDRGHQRFRLIEVDITNVNVRNIVDEKTTSFLWTAHTENQMLPTITWLEQTKGELFYVSEMSGWRHVYLVDAETGFVKNPITSGDWIVRGIEQVDEVNRQLWFRASGCFSSQDPYLIHFGRVNFDGTGLVWLTEGNGNHTLQYSPDKKFAIDTFSRVDLAPVTELRRVSDGKLMCELEHSDIDRLTRTGWSSPEVVVSKARDGVTDIWGFVCLPCNFDPKKSYPVLEDIYAGPHGSHVPKSFSPSQRYSSLTELGFIVVKVDGMGTANRSKAFHDVCWRNLKDSGFEDRILWMKAAALKHPQMDLERVGIYGTSAGGQNAAGAVLFHSEFYKVAVAACGCHDNRMDKASWNEQWMGYPVGPHYSESSNVDNAHRLQGKLLLIVGEMDTNVPPESTMRFADKLIKANKDFDLLVIPNAGHGMGGTYGQRKMHEFFVRHLIEK